MLILLLAGLGIILLGGIVFAMVFDINLAKRKKESCRVSKAIEAQFSGSAYLDRIEQAAIDILEERKPVDQTIILWWGLDGLTLDENGELKWISRKKPEPVNQNVFYQPCQSIFYADNYPVLGLNTCQNTQAKIDTLQMQNAALQMQAAQQAQIANIMNQVQTCCTPGLVSSQFWPYRSCHYGL